MWPPHRVGASLGVSPRPPGLGGSTAGASSAGVALRSRGLGALGHGSFSGTAPVRGRLAPAGHASGRVSSVPSSPAAGSPAAKATSSSCSPAPRRAVTPAPVPTSAAQAPLGSRTTAAEPVAVPASPNKRHAQYELTQKLRAMDLALERIERENLGAGGSQGHSSKENIDPLVATPCAVPSSPSRSLAPQSCVRQSMVALEVPVSVTTSRCHESTSWRRSETAEQAVGQEVACEGGVVREQSPGRTGRAQGLQGLGLATLEASWREAHSELRAEVAREIASFRDGLREGEEERQRGAVRLLTDFEVELTSALEARAKEADGLLEHRLIEATEKLQRQFTDLETSIRDNGERLSSLEGESQRRLNELEGAVKELESAAHADRARVTETGQSCGEALQVAKEQLATFRQRIQQLQDDGGESKEQVTLLSQRVKQLQSDRDDAKEQLGSLKLRLHQVQSESGGVAEEVDRRLQRIDDSVGTRLREAEAAFTAQLTAAQRALEGQVQELQRRLEDLQHRLLADVGELRAQNQQLPQREARAAAVPEERLAEFQHSCDLELAALRGRLEASELRCTEETQALRQSLEAMEARSAGALEVNLESRLRTLRGNMDERIEQALRQSLEAMEARSAGALEVNLASRLSTLRADMDERIEQERRHWTEKWEQLATTCSQDYEPPWIPALREFEREMKALLASQVEDSAAALRSVAAIVAEKERSWQSPAVGPDGSALGQQQNRQGAACSGGMGGPHVHAGVSGWGEEPIASFAPRRGMVNAPSSPMRSGLANTVPTWR